MYEFISVSKDLNPFIKDSFRIKINNLLLKHNNVLTDDFCMQNFDRLLDEVSPHLYVGLYNGEFIGFVYLEDWRGGFGKYFSATMTVCIEKKFRGRIAREASRKFIAEIFSYYNCYKLKSLVFPHNFQVMNYLLSLGFKKESVLLNETMKNGKPVDMDLYCIYKQDFIS